jgi:polar amino acid transport system permease protein
MTAAAMQHAHRPPATRAQARLWRLFLLAALLGVAWLARDLRWVDVWTSAGFLLRGLATSWILALTAIGLGALAAVPLALARMRAPAGLRHAAVMLIELVRATPELLVIFWLFFALPAATGKAVSGWTAAIAALGLIAAAHLAEVVRAGLLSVPKGQWDAALAVGLSPRQALIRVVLPQALRNMLPALIAQLVSLFKTTSLAYVVGVIEFFRAVSIVNNAVFAPYALYLTLAGVYFLCCGLLTWCVRRLDPDYLLAS